MSSILTIPVETRQNIGTGAARAIRRQGLVPGVVYGNKKQPHHISVDPRFIVKELYKPGFFSRLFTLALDGKNEEQVLAKAVQLHPVTDFPLHIDFFRVNKDSKIRVNVPLHFINEDKAPGVKKGGNLNIVHHSLELICSATAIPGELVIDLGKLEAGQGIHVSDIELPKGAKLAHGDSAMTLVNILAPGGAKAEAEA